MLSPALRRLPGVRFEAPPLPTGSLPRMDVAVFVGFAGKGPREVPVLVEDPARFTELFGDDLELAWDAQRGEIVTSLLGPTVRAFLRNGGRRCWVVRVQDPTLEGFDARVFYDPELVDLAPHLLALACERRARESVAGSVAALLGDDAAEDTPLFQGIHAAWAVEEATLIAVPDAVHRGWDLTPEPDDLALDAPSPPTPSEGTPSGCGCEDDGWKPPPRCAGDDPPEGAFRPTDQGPAPPTLSVVINDDATAFTLRWDPGSAETTYEVEESATRERSASTGHERLVEPSLIYAGSGADLDPTSAQRAIVVRGRAPGVWAYRIRAVLEGRAGAWSAIREVRLPRPPRALLKEGTDDGSALLRVHQALLRMCLARGDLVATLSLPERFREQDAIRYAERLRDPDDSAVPPEALSFGVLVHPWLLTLDPARGPLPTRAPADGAVCGVMAARALRRGAWISPANEPFADAVALSPALKPTRWLDLLAARVNVVRQEPRGFATLGAETLSDDPDLVEVSVRRLMCFLRRVVLQKGAEYVFEPHDEVFRREVSRSFRTILEDLFRRGAFAGKKPETAFQVRTGVDLNPPSLVEQGRMVVEIKVAPSIPLSFLTIQLVQQGEHATATEAR